MHQRVVRPGSSHWNILLGNEANDAASLFTHGLRITRDIRADYNDAAAAMSLLALGAEKLLKLTIGLAHLNRGEPWPSRRRMVQIGHRVATADVEARAMLDLSRGTVPGHMQERATQVQNDRVLVAALEALERFADRGRFYFLDSLGENPQADTAPHFLWIGMVSAIINSDVDLSVKMNTADGWKQERPNVNGVIVTSLRDWWEFYRAAWTTGVNGALAKDLSSAIRLLSH
ncbi:hypothetical protein [Couchioplanes azureus]|uniref:hypothetical protein n=1 Tax=Couchioplanes caeruleus TaxID=56438 RepID=UPI001670789A|nr:hypothetical protein [Couchioplanes caeruleus]GGQ70220.1 hypothetical protein GCM10010166_45100 [Couchioplanes caeruleus subsp. azureus]